MFMARSACSSTKPTFPIYAVGHELLISQDCVEGHYENTVLGLFYTEFKFQSKMKTWIFLAGNFVEHQDYICRTQYSVFSLVFL